MNESMTAWYYDSLRLDTPADIRGVQKAHAAARKQRRSTWVDDWYEDRGLLTRDERIRLLRLEDGRARLRELRGETE